MSPSYLQCYCSVVINVKDTKNLLEILLGRPVGHDVEDNHELAEVDMSILQTINNQQSSAAIQMKMSE